MSVQIIFITLKEYGSLETLLAFPSYKKTHVTEFANEASESLIFFPLIIVSSPSVISFGKWVELNFSFHLSPMLPMNFKNTFSNHLSYCILTFCLQVLLKYNPLGKGVFLDFPKD